MLRALHTLSPVRSMITKPIRSDDDLRAAFVRLEAIYQSAEGTPDTDERDVLVTLIESYEDKHFAIRPANPVEGQVQDGAAGP